MATLKLTDELCDNICNEIKAGVPIAHASVAHGISKSTFYSWYNKGKESTRKSKFKTFYEKVEEAKSIAITLRARRIYKAGEGNWQADAWWLERVDPENFGRKDHHTVQSESVNTNINFNMKSDDEVLKEHADTFERFIQRRMHKTDEDTN